MAGVVYAACALTALGCAWLLLRAYRRSGFRLLLWAGLCFAALTLSNALVVVDLLIVPHVSLFAWRNAAALAGLALLTVGLVWESRE